MTLRKWMVKVNNNSCITYIGKIQYESSNNVFPVSMISEFKLCNDNSHFTIRIHKRYASLRICKFTAFYCTRNGLRLLMAKCSTASNFRGNWLTVEPFHGHWNQLQHFRCLYDIFGTQMFGQHRCFRQCCIVATILHVPCVNPSSRDCSSYRWTFCEQIGNLEAGREIEGKDGRRED